MIFNNIRWLWSNSATICEEDGIVRTAVRIRFLIKALSSYSALKQLIEAPSDTSLGKLLRQRPRVVGAVMWPYQCVGWTVPVRLARIRDHYAVIDAIGRAIDFPPDDEIELLDLGEVLGGLKVVLDQPQWFVREGQLAVNLFLNDVRIYTLAFTFFHEGKDIAVFIGAIQGRNIDGALDAYRDLTKASHGVRPRDLLIEVFRMLCAEFGVTKIFAVADEYRHHRDPYFGQSTSRKTSANYNEVWTDRGGVRVDPMYYQLDMNYAERDIATIPSKKRGMYRRRFEMLGQIKARLHEKYSQLTAVSNRL